MSNAAKYAFAAQGISGGLDALGRGERFTGAFDLVTAGLPFLLGRSCFVAGTPVRTPGGSVPVEKLRPGDLVLSRDEFDPAGPVVAKAVEEVFRRYTSVWELAVGGRVVGTTGGHPFYSGGRGWVAAQELRVGERVLTEAGAWAGVESVADTGRLAAVYNCRVADYHTYFVGSEDWGFALWAHNAYGISSFGQLRGQVGALKAMGVDKPGRRAFLNGEAALFQLPKGSLNPTTYGMIQMLGGKLWSGIITIRDTSGAGLRAFADFRTRSFGVARAFGKSDVTIFGAAVIN